MNEQRLHIATVISEQICKGGLTYRQAANNIDGVSKELLMNVLRGKRYNVETLEKILNYYDLEIAVKKKEYESEELKMNKRMTYQEVFSELTKNIHGDAVFGIVAKHRDGYKIQPVDVTIMYPIGKGEPQQTITAPIILYTSNSGAVDFVEHSYNAFTTANKDAVERLVSLVGVVITDLKEVEPNCYSSIDEIKDTLNGLKE